MASARREQISHVVDSTQSQELDLLLNELEERGLNPSPVELGRLKLAMLSTIEPLLDAVVLNALLSAKEFLQGQPDGQAVQNAMETCWAHANQKWPGGSLEATEACATRAVISLLHGLINPEDFLDSMSFFLALVNRVQPDQARQLALMRLHFENSDS